LNILFVCSRNKWRSATAETIYKNSQQNSVKSAGTEPSAVVKVSAKMIRWADIIFAMEKKHKQRLITNYPGEASSKRIIVLHIGNNYKYMDAELIEMIRTAVDPYFSD
jgi:predicted protein tyrosine phosphatase